MDKNFEELVIDVRATTSGFNADIEQMRSSLDTSLAGGFAQAGERLERGLLSALRRGKLGFEDLKRIGMGALDSIASHALQSGLNSLIGSGSTGGGLGGLLTGSLGALLGLPGRATGGPVSPGRGYIVGENGPELFVPTTSGKVAANGGPTRPSNDVRVSISLSSPRGTTAPTAMQRSSRQVASAVRRALQER